MQIYSWMKPTALFIAAFGLGIASSVIWNNWKITRKTGFDTTDEAAANHQVLLGLFRTKSVDYLMGITENSLNLGSLKAYTEILKGHVKQLYDDNSELRIKINSLLSPPR